jgi:hypothetical protein
MCGEAPEISPLAGSWCTAKLRVVSESSLRRGKVIPELPIVTGARTGGSLRGVFQYGYNVEMWFLQS